MLKKYTSICVNPALIYQSRIDENAYMIRPKLDLLFYELTLPQAAHHPSFAYVFSLVLTLICKNCFTLIQIIEYTMGSIEFFNHIKGKSKISNLFNKLNHLCI